MKINFKSKLKNQSGSISLYVLLTCLFLSILLISAYVSNMNKLKIQEEQVSRIKENYNYSEEELSSKYKELSNNSQSELPDNSLTVSAGTYVKLNNNWKSQMAYTVDYNNGDNISTSAYATTVYAVSDGLNNTIPIPYGFYYVGGTLDTGVVISDKVEDKNIFAGKPSVGYDELSGNQFVWIPANLNDAGSYNYYSKTSWGKENSNYDTTTSSSEYTQIQKYGGFYLARFEAGLPSNITPFETYQENNGTNFIYSQIGIPVSKYNQVPWNFIKWGVAKSNAESMYSTSYITSGLITGTQWDVVLKTIIEKAGLTQNDISNNSASWGNYSNDSISFLGNFSSFSNGNQYPFGNTTDGLKLYKTGTSQETLKYNLSDIAGSLWEWTEEISTYATSGQYRVIRGGSFTNDSSVFSACYRDGSNSTENSFANVGFRVVLYMK